MRENSSTAWVLFYENSLVTFALPFSLYCIKFSISVAESVKAHIWRVSVLGSPKQEIRQCGENVFVFFLELTRS